MLETKSKSTIARELILKDGRTLSYAIYGDPDGVPVVFSHGLSDSRCIRHHDDDLTRSLGVRIVAVDQPGVGESTPVPWGERTLINYAADVEELADALGLGEFAVAGHSGGGPHALAVAARLPGRVTRCVLAAPAPPLTIPGMVGLFPLPGFGIILWICRCFSFVVYGLCHVWAWWANRDIRRYIDVVAESDRTSGNPETFLGEPKQTQVFRDNFEQGLVQGAIGLQGMLKVAFVDVSWGFDWKVRQPVAVFACNEDPIITTEMLGLFCDHLPNATLQTWPNAGHYSFVDPEPWKSLFAPLTK